MPYNFRIFNEGVGTASKQIFWTQRHDDTLIKSSWYGDYATQTLLNRDSH